MNNPKIIFLPWKKKKKRREFIQILWPDNSAAEFYFLHRDKIYLMDDSILILQFYEQLHFVSKQNSPATKIQQDKDYDVS